MKTEFSYRKKQLMNSTATTTSASVPPATNDSVKSSNTLKRPVSVEFFPDGVSKPKRSTTSFCTRYLRLRYSIQIFDEVLLLNGEKRWQHLSFSHLPAWLRLIGKLMSLCCLWNIKHTFRSVCIHRKIHSIPPDGSSETSTNKVRKTRIPFACSLLLRNWPLSSFSYDITPY